MNKASIKEKSGMSERLEQLKAKKAILEQKIKDEKRRASAAKRREDTKIKILMGSYIIEQIGLADVGDKVPMYNKSNHQWEIVPVETALDAFLTRDSDRALFELEPK